MAIRRPPPIPRASNKKTWADSTAQTVIAQGYPVVVVSPSRSKDDHGDRIARANRIELQIPQRKVILSGGQDVSLDLRTECAPRADDYVPTARPRRGDQNRQLPRRWPRHASLRARPQQARPGVRRHLEGVGRSRSQQRTTGADLGRPPANVDDGHGRADRRPGHRLSARTREPTSKSEPQATTGTASAIAKIQVVPDRMDAVGQVEIDSPQMLARTRELKAQFQSRRRRSQANPARTPAPQPAAAARGNRRSRIHRDVDLAPEQLTQRADTNQIVADQIQLQIAIRGTIQRPTNLACNGNVAFRQIPKPALPTSRSMCAAASSSPTSSISTTRAHDHPRRGTERTARLAAYRDQSPRHDAEGSRRQLDQGQNRLWVDGPGQAIVTPRTTYLGNPAAAPTPYDIHWQGGLNFDGRHIVIQREMTVVGADDRVWCDQFVGTLAAARSIRPAQRFAKARDGRGRVPRQRRHRPSSPRRSRPLTSHERGQLARLSINQQTGRITGDGPGVFARLPAATQTIRRHLPHSRDRQTTCGQSHTAQLPPHRFSTGPRRQSHTKEIAFHQRVHTIYGPVDSWEQELDVKSSGNAPTRHAHPLERRPQCERRSARRPDEVETPGQGGSKLGPIQMRATGSVQIDGSSPRQGVFAASAASAAYEQLKEMFVLEGTDRQPATLRHQSQAGGQLKLVTDTARKIQFNRITWSGAARRRPCLRIHRRAMRRPRAKKCPRPAPRRQ